MSLKFLKVKTATFVSDSADPVDYPPDPGILRARTLVWVAFPTSQRGFWPGGSGRSHIAGGILYQLSHYSVI